jgi:hypothetical protein
METIANKSSVKLPKSFVAINLSEISPQLFGPVRKDSTSSFYAETDVIGLESEKNTPNDDLEQDLVDERNLATEVEEEFEGNMPSDKENDDDILVMDSSGSGVELQ